MTLVFSHYRFSNTINVDMRYIDPRFTYLLTFVNETLSSKNQDASDH